jgi:hypothetical protein
MAREKPKILRKQVLTISAAEYCKSSGKHLEDFVLEGVNVSSSWGIDVFIRNVPLGTEVVVSYSSQNRATYLGPRSYEGVAREGTMSGTAMIPKSYYEKLKKKR